MDHANSPRARAGLSLTVLSLLFLTVLFVLSRHPETAALLISLPSPAAFACNLRCLGLGPTLQVLGEAGQALLMIFVSLSLLYALARSVLWILRTLTFIDRAEEKAVPVTEASRFPFWHQVTVLKDPLPLAFTGGFFKPRVFVSTRLGEVLSETELRAVILHELHHQRSKDPLKGLLVSFLSDFLFFLPVSRFLKKTYSLTAEVAADAHSVARRAEPVDLASSLRKVRPAGSPATSWFFDPAVERARLLLGERSKIRRPLARIVLSAVVLAAAAFIALVPVKKSVSAMFINHDQTCVLRSGHRWEPASRRY